MAEIKQPLLTLQPSERRSVVRTDEDSRVLDDKYILFGTRGKDVDYLDWDARLGYNSAKHRLELKLKRETTTFPNRNLGLHVDADELFIGEGAKQARAVVIEGERAATGVMGGDAHDFLLELAYTNRAVNTPAGSYARALSIQATNRDSGEIGSLQGALISTRQRGDGAEAGEQRVLRIDLTHDVGGAVATGWQEGIRVNMKIHAVGPTPGASAGAAGITVNNDATGNYGNKPVGFAVRTIGQQWSYGLSFFDETTETCESAEIRMMSEGSGGPLVIASGTASSSAAIITQLGAVSDGSLYVEASDSGGKLWQKRSGTFTTTLT